MLAGHVPVQHGPVVRGPGALAAHELRRTVGVHHRLVDLECGLGRCRAGALVAVEEKALVFAAFVDEQPLRPRRHIVADVAGVEETLVYGAAVLVQVTLIGELGAAGVAREPNRSMDSVDVDLQGGQLAPDKVVAFCARVQPATVHGVHVVLQAAHFLRDIGALVARIVAAGKAVNGVAMFFVEVGTGVGEITENASLLRNNIGP